MKELLALFRLGRTISREAPLSDRAAPNKQ